MRFRFNEKKTAEAAAHLLKLSGGRLNYMVLIKLMYLADRQMLLDHGTPITGDAMFSMKNGPILSRVLDLITEEPPPGSAWAKYIGAPSAYEVSLKVETPETDELSRYELRLLDETFAKYGKMDKWALVDWCHNNLREWIDPGVGSRTIEPADIFRAVDRSDSEIERVRRDADEIWAIGALG
jgi:uncharacterized phage-associated protein